MPLNVDETFHVDENGLIFYTNKVKPVFQQIVKNLQVEVCYFANGIQIQGFTVPAIETRRVKTVVELGDGQSFAIAGYRFKKIKADF